MFVFLVLPPWVVVFGLLGAVPFNNNLEVGRLASPCLPHSPSAGLTLGGRRLLASEAVGR